MKVTLTEKQNINIKHRKENSFQQEFIGLAIVGDEIKEAVNCRIYGTQSRNYCCIWYRNDNIYSSGSGYAGGYGYHRPSAAAETAMTQAGVKLSEYISGRGDYSIQDAVLAITKELYPNTVCQVIKSHG